MDGCSICWVKPTVKSMNINPLSWPSERFVLSAEHGQVQYSDVQYVKYLLCCVVLRSTEKCSGVLCCAVQFSAVKLSAVK